MSLILNLYIKSNPQEWNQFLNESIRKRDMEGLSKMYRRLQEDMSNLAKQKLNTDNVNQLYARMLASIENTMRRILKIKHPSPLDRRLTKEYSKQELANFKLIKQNREKELQKFLKKVSY